MKKQTRVRVIDSNDSSFNTCGTVVKTVYNKTWGCNLVAVLLDGDTRTWRFFARQLVEVK